MQGVINGSKTPEKLPGNSSGRLMTESHRSILKLESPRLCGVSIAEIRSGLQALLGVSFAYEGCYQLTTLTTGVGPIGSRGLTFGAIRAAFGPPTALVRALGMRGIVHGNLSSCC